MKHSAKAVAKLAREQEKLARQQDAQLVGSVKSGRARAGVAAPTAPTASAAGPQGLAPAGRVAPGRAAATQPAASQAAAGQASAGQAAVGQAAVGQAAVGQAAVGQAAAGQVAASQPGAGQAAAGQPAFGGPGRPDAAAGAGRGRFGQVPYLIVLIGAGLGLVLMRSSEQAVRGGTLVIAGALLAGSVTRLVLPDGKAGMLRSRRRFVDVAALTILGIGLLIAGLILQVPG
jgi:hypothetical protein